MMIDWLNPSDDILEAKRIGYEDGVVQGEDNIGQVVDDLQARIAELEAERDNLRQKNRELNRRAQTADAATADAKQCLDKLAAGIESGTPWCDGSLGRKLLAWNAHQQDQKIAELEAAAEKLPKTRDGVGVTLGMVVYATWTWRNSLKITPLEVAKISVGQVWNTVVDTSSDSDSAVLTKCYSTRKAAEAAEAAIGGE